MTDKTGTYAHGDTRAQGGLLWTFYTNTRSNHTRVAGHWRSAGCAFSVSMYHDGRYAVGGIVVRDFARAVSRVKLRHNNALTEAYKLTNSYVQLTVD
jgi:hypothetical protein